MSDLIALLQRLDALEVRLSTEGGKLKVNAPKGRLTAELTAELRQHKEALVAFLREGDGARDVIPVASRDGALPLTLGQERLWFIDQLEGQSSAYNLHGAFRMRGRCDEPALRRALASVISRHEILRTTFPERGGAPVQHIAAADEAPLPLTCHDLRGQLDAERLAREQCRAQALAPFDLARGPLLRVVLLTLSDDEALFLVAMHHIVSDGWSMGRFVEEVATCYAAAVRGEHAALPALPIQVADFAVWQRRWAEAGQLAAQVEFWRQHLHGAPPLLELPADHRRPATPSYRGRTLHFALAPDLGARLRQLAQDHQCTPYMLLLAAFAALLARLSGQHDLPIASPIANRNREETEALIGFFVNTLVSRVRVDPAQPFTALLAQVRRTSLEAFTHQDAPFSHVVDALGPERNPSYNPVFQVMFDLQNTPSSAVELAGLRLEPLLLDDGAEGTAMFDLSWTMQEDGAGFTGQVEYALELFEQVTIERWISAFRQLLEALAVEPATPLAALPLLSPQARREAVELGCAPPTGRPAGCVHLAIAEQARRAPEALAVVWNDEELCYAELDGRANQLAHHLAALGVRRGDRVGLCLERCLEMPIAVLGVLKAGAAYVPLDPSYPAERLAFMQRDAELRCVLTKQAHAAGFAGEEVQVLAWEELAPSLGAWPRSAPALELGPEDAAYVIYTSGSTGLPKGVVMEHGPWLATYHAWEREYRLLDEARSHLQMAAFSFDVCAGDLVRALCSGGTLVLCPREYLLAPAELYALLARRQVACAEFVPAVLRELARYLEEQGQDLAFMRVLIAGSDVWYGEEYQRFRRLCGPRTRLINSYGVTEAVIDSTYFEAGARALHPERHVPIGRPFPDTRLYVLDERGEPVPPGVAGELFLAGPRLAREYWRRPALTAERFLRDPFVAAAGARMYRTGDAARFLYDGQLEFLGRVDLQVKIRGHRIELGEIETALAKHPRVHSAVAHVHSEAPGQALLVGYVVAHAAEPEAEELRAFLAARLPSYMVPAVFVPLAALPMTPNGKVDRKALPPPRPGAAARAMASEEPPIGPVEQALAAIWQALLAAPVARSSNFFALGGDSILAIQVVSRARAAGLRLDARMLFQHQTLAELAAAAESLAARAPAVARAPEPLEGEVAWSPIQRWFVELGAPTPHHYNQSVVLELDPGLEPERMVAALQLLPALHPALRLRWREGGAGQCYGSAAESLHVPCEVIRLGAAESLAEAVARHGEAAQRSLHLERGPLLRAAWLHDGDQARLLLVAHHWVIDGVSWRILLEDLATALAGQTPQPEATSFAAWTAALRARAVAPRTLADVPRWRGVVAAAPSLPVEHAAAGANTVAGARSHESVLDPATTAALLTSSQRAYRTRIDELLLTALALAFQERFGTTSLLLELESHGRFAEEEDGRELDLGRTVGWFTSAYPVCLRLPVSADLGECVPAVKEQLRALPESGWSYGLLRYLHPDPEVRRSVTPAHPVALGFNYLGQVDAGASLGALRGLASEPTGPEQDLELPRSYLLELNARVSDGALRTTWEYAAASYRPETIEALAAAFCAALRALVAHCCDPRSGTLTPADVPLARLPAAALAQLVARVAHDAALPARDVIEDVYPLSPMQAGMLYHSLLEPERGYYVEQVRCTLRGTFQPALFARAWQVLTERHQVLRTAFVVEGLPEPLQVVLARVTVPARLEDWRGRAELPRALEELAAAEHARGFALDRAPLHRWCLVRVADERYHLIWTHHHLLLDGWSLPVLFQELFAVCAALHQGSAAALPPAPPYQRYIAWLQQQDLEAARSFWRARLREVEAATPLPGDHTGRAQDRGAATAVRRHHLGAESTRTLEEAARRASLTLSTLAQAAWALLLCQYSGQRDVVFGATVAGRPPELVGAETMVGLLINTLPVRVVVEPARAPREWLAELQRRQQDATPYSYAPLVEVAACSGIAPGTPLFESLLVFENYPLGRDDAPSSLLALEEVQAAEHTNYPLTLVVAPGARLELALHFEPGRVHRDLAATLLERLAALLERLADPPATLGELLTLPRAERTRLLTQWNQTEREHPAGCLHHALAAAARRSPERVAVIAADETLRYGELDARAERFARRLRALGVGPDVVVGLYAERSAAMLVALLAILKAGGAYLPLDPGFPAERLEYMARDAGAPLLVVAGLEPAALPAALAAGPWQVVPLAAPEAEPVAVPPPVASQPHHLAYAIYTSGSTGLPKGTLLEHRSVMNFLASMRERPGLTADDVVLAVTTLSFDIAVLELYLPLVCGARVVIATRAQAADPTALQALLEAHRVTLLQATPATWRMLVTAGWRGSPRLRALSGGEALAPELAAALLPRVAELWNLYGPTETTVWSTVARLTPEALAEGASVPIGHPIANTQAYVLDATLAPVPVGAIGELYLGGAGVARGYHRRPELTAERFVADPARPGRRMYRTGDLARYRVDGSLECLGRIDQQIKLRGYRIELGEIESLLLTLPGIEQAVALVREDQPGDPRLVAYAVARAPLAAWREPLAAKLPSYMVPSELVWLEALPLTPNGKLDRRALPAPARLAGGPERGPRARPRDALEAALVRVWEEVLGVEVGVHEDFFALGGHSLAAIRLLAQVQARLEVRLPLAALHQAPTVAALAQALRAQRGVAAPLVVPLAAGAAEVPWFLFPGAGGNVTYLRELARALGPDRAGYGVRALGLEPGEQPPEQVEAMAAAALRALRAHAPRGPYLLAGHSFGADVAWAVAQLVREQGEEVALLVSLDSPAPRARALGADAPAHQWFAAVAEVLAQEVPELDLRGLDFAALPDEQQAAALAQRLVAALVLPPAEAESTTARFVRVFRANHRAGFAPRALPGVPVLLVRAADEPPPARAPWLEEPAWGWPRLTDGPVQEVVVAGDHQSLLHAPQVVATAEQVRAALARLGERR